MISLPAASNLVPRTPRDDPSPISLGEDVVAGEIAAGRLDLDDTDWNQILNSFVGEGESVIEDSTVRGQATPPLKSGAIVPLLPKPIFPKLEASESPTNTSLLSMAKPLSGSPVHPDTDILRSTGKNRQMTIPPLPPSHVLSSDAAEVQYIASFDQDEVRQNAFFFIVSRGGMIVEQPGNRRLRRIVNMFAPEYVDTHRPNRGALKHQVFNLCRCQFEFVIQKQVFMRFYERDMDGPGRRHLSTGRIESILRANGGLALIQSCKDTDFIRVGEECALDVVGHLLRDAANEVRRARCAPKDAP